MIREINVAFFSQFRHVDTDDLRMKKVCKWVQRKNTHVRLNYKLNKAKTKTKTKHTEEDKKNQKRQQEKQRKTNNTISHA